MPVRLWVAAVALLAAILRLPTLDVQGFWVDEAATVAVLREPWGGLLQAVADSESTPPLYYVLAKAWSLPLGLGEVGLRSLSAVLGVAAVPVAAALGRRLAGDRAAVVAALLVATSPLLQWMSQEARAYALLTLLVPFGVLALLRALEEPRPSRLLAWGVLALAAIATHWFALFLVAPQVLVVVLAAPRRPASWLAAAVPVLGGAALLPLLLGQQDAARAVFIGDEPLLRRLAQVPKQFLVGYDAPAEALLTALAGIAVLVAAAGVLKIVRRGAPSPGVDLRPPSPPVAARAARLARGRGALLVVGAVGLCGVALPVALELLGQPYVLARNLLGALPLLLVVAAAGFAASPRLSRARVGAVAAGVLAVCGVVVQVGVARDATLQRDDWRSAIAAAGAPTGPRVLLVVPSTGRLAIDHYLRAARTPAVGVANVAEIVTVTVATGADRATPPPPAASPNPAFTMVSQRLGATWRTVRWRAPVPSPLDPNFFAGAGADILVRVQG